tara:strand:- start:9622 stop:10905 length:1284 start_codon:yes stop_codon:yes gene_type:complete
MSKKILLIISSMLGYFFISSVARAEVDAETAYIFNTFLFLVCGFLVMWMAAGFAMLESGLVTSKSVSTIAAKNIGLYSIAGMVFWVVGYNLAYGISPGGFIGTFSPWSDSSNLDTGYSDGSDWFFQMVFCATTCSIVSGTLAERIKIWPFFLFAAILAGIIYPIEMGWQWGGGFLAELGFSDFAGSTLVHSAGGSAALAGAIILGARKGRFDNSGKISPMEPFASSSIPLATLGVFVLWLGWFGFNGGSQLALGSFDDSTAVATIFINTNLAACAGVMTNAVITRLMFGKTDVIQMLNGALGGLVAITAEPLAPSPELAMLIGAIGGAIVVFGSSLLLKFRIDDVVGAIPVHLFAGIFGTLAVCLSTDVSLAAQITGILSVNIFVFVISYIIWTIMKATIGIRISSEAEEMGTDTVEVGVSAYAIRD